MICVGCGQTITFTETHGWRGPDRRPYCGPGRTRWHEPTLTPEEIAADAAEFVDTLRSAASAQSAFWQGITR